MLAQIVQRLAQQIVLQQAVHTTVMAHRAQATLAVANAKLGTPRIA